MGGYSCSDGLGQTSFTVISLLSDGRSTCPDGFWLKCVLKCPVDKGGDKSYLDNAHIDGGNFAAGDLSMLMEFFLTVISFSSASLVV